MTGMVFVFSSASPKGTVVQIILLCCNQFTFVFLFVNNFLYHFQHGNIRALRARNSIPKHFNATRFLIHLSEHDAACGGEQLNIIHYYIAAHSSPITSKLTFVKLEEPELLVSVNSGWPL